MADASGNEITTLVAAYLVDVDVSLLGLDDQARASALASLPIDHDILTDTLHGVTTPTLTLIRAVDKALGAAGVVAPRTTSPFAAIRLLRTSPASERVLSVRPARARPLREVGNLDAFAGRCLRALDHLGLAAPGAADVPLVDFIRLRVALVAAILRSGSEAGPSAAPLLWLTGDLSGIQSYLYDIAHTGEGGVARRLRARSFFLQLLSEDVAERLRRSASLPRAVTFMRSGGKFHMVLPDTTTMQTRLMEEQATLDQWLLEETQGEVAVVLGWQPFMLSDLNDGAGIVLRQAEARLAERKAERYAAALRDGDHWSEESFVRRPIGAAADPCASCKKQTAGADKLCDRCRADGEVGRVLPHAERVRLVGGGAPVAGGVRLSLPGSAAIIDHDVPEGVRLLSISLRDLPPPGEAGNIGAHIPSDPEGERLSFDELPSKGRGRQLLGYLKMDVDRLGEIFAFGLRRDDGPNLDTLPRIAAISRLLDQFFGRELRLLLEREFPYAYQVYAGGDDVLVIGPWWDTVQLAVRIRDEFAKWVGGNPEITISAGITLARRRQPVAEMARAADVALEQAKHGAVPLSGGLLEARLRRGMSIEECEGQPAPVSSCMKRGGRDAIALLGDVLSWEHMSEVVRDAETLAAMQPPSALLHRLVSFSAMWNEFQDGDTSGLRLFPYLMYTLRRNVDERREPDLHKWIVELAETPHADADEGKVGARLEHLGLIARLALLLTSKGA